MTQQNYARPQTGRVGMARGSGPHVALTGIYASQAEIHTLTFGGAATDGSYVATFQDLPGGLDDIAITVVRAAGVPATNADLAAAMEAAIEANDDLRALLQIATAGAVNTVSVREDGLPIGISTSAPGAGTLVDAVTQSASKPTLALGIGVVRTGGDENQIRVPAPGDTGADIYGITVLGSTQIAPLPLEADASIDDHFPPGSVVPAAITGDYWARPEVAVSKDDPIFVRVTAAGSEVFGALSNVADGGDNVQIPGRWETNTAAPNQRAVARFNIPG